jgi:very-short-patch-repair endonuclease
MPRGIYPRKPWTEEEKARRREAFKIRTTAQIAAGKAHSQFLTGKKRPPMSSEQKEQIRRTLLTRNASIKRTVPPFKPEHRAKMSEARKKYLEKFQINFPLPTSSLEGRVAVHFSSWSKQYRIGRFTVDFALPEEKRVVEVYGCYWHACVECALVTNQFSIEEVRKRDETRLNFLREKGWNVEIIWEHGIDEWLEKR